MDSKGKKQELTETKDAILPAWSPDGSRLAWLQKDGKKKYELRIAKTRQ
jgi:Tol biopolymer transport system component